MKYKATMPFQSCKLGYVEVGQVVDDDGSNHFRQLISTHKLQPYETKVVHDAPLAGGQVSDVSSLPEAPARRTKTSRRSRDRAASSRSTTRTD